MKIKYFYLIICALGLILPYSQMIPFYDSYGFDMILLFQKQFAEPAVSFFGFDLMIAVMAAMIFIIIEGQRLKVRHYWVSIALIFLIGVSFGFPLFLYMREAYLENKN